MLDTVPVVRYKSLMSNTNNVETSVVMTEGEQLAAAQLRQLRAAVRETVREDGIYLVAMFRGRPTAELWAERVRELGGQAFITKEGTMRKIVVDGYETFSKTIKLTFTVGILADQYLAGRMGLKEAKAMAPKDPATRVVRVLSALTLRTQLVYGGPIFEVAIAAGTKVRMSRVAHGWRGVARGQPVKAVPGAPSEVALGFVDGGLQPEQLEGFAWV